MKQLFLYMKEKKSKNIYWYVIEEFKEILQELKEDIFIEC